MLTGEPFFLTIDQIKKLTPWQVQHVYFAERKEDGSVAVAPSGWVAPKVTRTGSAHRAAQPLLSGVACRERWREYVGQPKGQKTEPGQE